MAPVTNRLRITLSDSWRILALLGFAIAIQAGINCAYAADAGSAHQGHTGAHQHGHAHGEKKVVPARFIATTEKSFAELMDDAMVIMDDGMTNAPMNGKPEHDFVTMMVPHHQGAVDMAKALLLYSKDPELLNLAQGIIAEQQNEIKLMQLWLKRHGYTPMPSNDGK